MATPQPNPPASSEGTPATPSASPPAILWEWHGALFSVRCTASATPGTKQLHFLPRSAAQRERGKRLREGLRIWFSRGVASLLLLLPLVFSAVAFTKGWPWQEAALMAGPGLALAVWLNLRTGNLRPTQPAPSAAATTGRSVTWLGWFVFWLAISGAVVGIGAAIAYLGFAFTGRFDDSLRFGLGGVVFLLGVPVVLACVCQCLANRRKS